MPSFDLPRPQLRDLVAGVSVGLVLIPQSLAYAELAGLPPFIGLFAASVPLLVFAVLASSPYLQTGPVALTSLLTFAALPDNVAPDQLPKIAAILALLVGAIRLVLGLGRAGRIVHLMSSPVVMGFTSGAAVVIMSSQFPKAVGVDPPEGGVIGRALWALGHIGQWQAAAVALAALTIVLFLGGRKISSLFPGVLVAVIIGIAFSRGTDYEGETVNFVPEGLPPFSLDLPWAEIPTLALGALVIALVGFAEPASIARTFANESGDPWDADRELFASGVANVVAAASGGYPIGGSFSRSSVNKLAGAQTRWSGGVTGLVVLAFLPFASVLEPLPTAVLGGIVLAAVSTLVKPIRLLRLWQRSPQQALLAWATFAATLYFTPRIERAVLVGIALTVVAHFGRRLELSASHHDDGSVVTTPTGLIWMGTDAAFAQQLRDVVTNSTGSVTLDFARTPFLNPAAIDTMAEVSSELAKQGRELHWVNPPDGTQRMLEGVKPRVTTTE